MPPYLNGESYYDDNEIGLVGRATNGGRNASWVGVPLVGVNCEADVVDFIAECRLTQCYENVGANPIEAKYVFPMDESAAVCGFQAEYEDGRIVKGVVKEKEQARSEFQQAIRNGKQANLLETVRRDVFSLEVGNLLAGAFVKITITYVTSLKARDDAAAFILSTYIAPRYTPCSEKLSREETQAMTVSSSAVKLFGMSIKVNFSCLSNIKEIACPTHQNEPGLSTWFGGKTGNLMLQAPMDRDLVALVMEEECHQPRAVVEKSPSGSMVGFVTLYPKMEFPDLKREFIFLIDRSGSMAGSKMKQASETLMLFLRALPVSCTFNIVGFGSTFSSLFPRPTSYNDETLQIASRYATRMAADFGGTEIKPPLEHIFRQPFPPNMDRQVFVLTDGQVSNDLLVFDVIRQYCSNDAKCRLFSLGLGSGVSRHLVEGMARAGRGTSRFVEGGAPVELREKVLGQLKQALQPSLHNVNIKWNFPSPTAASCPPIAPPVKTLLGYRSPAVDHSKHSSTAVPKTFPTNIPPVFNKERFLSYALFPEGSKIPKSVTVSCATSEGILETTLEIGKDEVFQGTIAHRMAARAGISEYEDHRKTRSAYSSQWCPQATTSKVLTEGEALQLALTNGLASEQTSFISVLDGSVMRRPNSCLCPNSTTGRNIATAGAAMPYSSTPFASSPMVGGAEMSPFVSEGAFSPAVGGTSFSPAYSPESGRCGSGFASANGPTSPAYSPPGQTASNLNRGPDFSHGISLHMDDEVEETTRRVGFNPSFAPSNISFQPPPMMAPMGNEEVAPMSHSGMRNVESAQDGGYLLVPRSGSATPSFVRKETKGSDWTFGLKNKMSKWLNPDATCADLGDSMQAYYDGGKRSWVFPGEESQNTSPPPPPPRTMMMQQQAAPRQVSRSTDPISFMMAPPQRKPPTHPSFGHSAPPPPAPIPAPAPPKMALPPPQPLTVPICGMPPPPAQGMAPPPAGKCMAAPAPPKMALPPAPAGMPPPSPSPGGFAGNDIIPHFARNGTALAQEERDVIAKRKGLCVQCGTKTHTISVFKRAPLTNENVHMGICIKCNPTSVPAKALRAWEHLNSHAKQPTSCCMPPPPGQPGPGRGIPPRQPPPGGQGMPSPIQPFKGGPTVAAKFRPSCSSLSDPLLDLCVLQRANGSFVWDSSLTQALSWSDLDMEEVLLAVTATATGQVVTDPTTKGTVLAVAAMRVFFAEQKLVWELQEEKAIQFLSSQGLSRLDIDSLLNATAAKLGA